MTTNYVTNGSGQVHITAANQSWVVNSGFTVAATPAAFLVDVDANIFNYGGIVSLTQSGVYYTSGSGYLLNGATGSITGFDGVAIDGTSGHSLDIVNFGMIAATDFYGVYAGGTALLFLDNHGYVYGEENAVAIFGAAFGVINNYGTLEARGGPAVYVDTTSTTIVSLSNSGTISGAVDLVNCAHFVLENSGTMSGMTTNGNTTITNSGTMGDVNITGSSSVTNAGHMGDFFGGADSDNVGNSGTMGLVSLGGGEDVYAASGSASSFQVRGGSGNDSLTAGKDGQYFGEQGNDFYGFLDPTSIAEFNETGGDGKDTVVSVADFSLSGSHVVGKIENLTLFFDAIVGTGNSLKNIITGDDKNNVLDGLGGKDTLIGGAGADDLTGGSGNDTFTYHATTESGPAASARDKINGFVHGEDKINVHSIDANTTVAGNQDFTSGDFLAGQFMVAQSGGDTLISFNTDGDAAAEMVIVLKGYTGTFDASDLIA